jgi:hypothetical protein
MKTQNHQTEKPRYEHPHHGSIFLGHFEDYDLYFSEDLLSGITVIARFGGEFHQYSSGLCFATKDGNPALFEARKRAYSKGLLSTTSKWIHRDEPKEDSMFAGKESNKLILTHRTASLRMDAWKEKDWEPRHITKVYAPGKNLAEFKLTIYQN